MKSRTWVWTAALTIAFASLALGCDVTPEKIKRWKRSEKGPPKIRAAVRDTSLKMDLRVMAAEALAERPFGPLGEDIASLSGSDKTEVTNQLLQKLMATMKGAGPQATTALQGQAKDALFSLRRFFTEEQRRGADEAVVTWLLGDFSKRQSGEHSGEKIIKTIGKDASALLGSKIDPDPASVVPVATLLGTFGDPKDREAGAGRLIAAAKASGKPTEQLIEALGRVDAAPARAYLVTLVQGTDPGAQKLALLSLKLKPNADVVKPIAGVAQNPKASGLIRDEAFAVLEGIPGDETLAALAVALDDTDKLVRYRTVEAMLACCKVAGVSKLLASLPSSYDWEKKDVADYIEKDIIELGKAALPSVRAGVSSSSWVARVVSARVLGAIGEKQDLAALQKLGSDRAKLQGWGEAGATVGSEARAAAASLKKRTN